MNLPARARALTALLGLSLMAACDQATEPGAPLAQRSGSGASVQSSSPGNAAKSGQIASRILVDKAGQATFEIRTGTFDNATGAGQFDGVLEQVHYRVADASGKLLLNRTVALAPSGTPASVYSETVPLATPNFDPGYSVEAQANLRAVGGDGKRTDVVRGSTAVMLAPDLDLQPQTPVQVGFGVDVNDPGFFAASPDVKVATPTPFQVVFNNTGPGGTSSVAALASCSVRVYDVNVDGSTGAPVATQSIPYQWWTISGLQNATPPGASWSSSTPILLPANGVAGCRFILSLDGLGTRKRVVVTINSLSPGDYDTSNNTVTTDFNVVDYTPAQPPAEGQALGQAYEITTFDGPTVSNPGNFVGIVRQQLNITGLSALVVNGAISSGTFTLRVKMGTAPALADGSINLASVTPMADAEWTGTVASLVAATGGCVASTTSGTLTNNLPPANLGQPTTSICVDPVTGGLLRLRVLFDWTSNSVGVAGGVPFGKFVRFNVGLNFSAYADQLGANANMKLTDLAYGGVQAYGTPGYTFGVCTSDPCERTVKPYIEAVRVQSP